ncbi:MAG TPA: hypothetical protein VGP80_12995 [Gemmatimonadales bacterium]|nr:hypothetical protein [Gemmatimonadales bacterium]
MARTSSKSGDPIDRLLSERQQFAVWLARLDATSDTAPESVRARVRMDYKARLDAVIEQLRSHADGIVEQLGRYRDTRAELLTRESQAKEIMSEAEVRHAVGEYGEAKWQQLRGEAQRNLVTIREELAELGEEISELEKVQAMIATPVVVAEIPAPPPPAPAPPTPAPSAPTPPVATQPPAHVPPLPVSAPPPPAAAVRPSDDFPEFSAAFNELAGNSSAPAASPAPAAPPQAAQPQPPKPPAPEPPRPPGPGQTTIRPAPGTVRPVKPKEGSPQGPAGRTLWFPSVKEEEVNTGVDELAFLKSVSEDEKGGPSARRASGGIARPPETLGPPNVSTTGEPPLTTAAHTLEPSGPHAEIPGRPSIPTAQRTLKCGECGTMNRPTEWYCERCGAELADL